MKFTDIINDENIYLYCGCMPRNRREYTQKQFVGLSLKQDNTFHIKHNILNQILLKDNSVNIIQSEDVFEHIEYSKLKNIINEIYRLLKPNGLFRLSIPDYSCDVLYKRSLKDENGNILFDKYGGGKYNIKTKEITHGGHLWFPKYNSVKELLESINFSNEKIKFRHYYDENNNPITHKIDYSFGYIGRTPDFDERVQNPYRPMSIIIDCYK